MKRAKLTKCLFLAVTKLKEEILYLELLAMNIAKFYQDWKKEIRLFNNILNERKVLIEFFMKRFAFFVMALVLAANTLSAQHDTLIAETESLLAKIVKPSNSSDTIKYVLTLEDVIDLVITQSSAIKYIQNTNVNYYWRYRNYRTQFRPQLLFRSDLPNYRHTTEPITQPD